jgi:hypothetical protein
MNAVRTFDLNRRPDNWDFRLRVIRPEPEPPALASRLASYLANLPPPPMSGVDESGRAIPLSDEERRAKADRLARALDEINRTASDRDTEEVWREVYRTIDEDRPHRTLLEGMY